jgi:S-adenosylmethionine/arginine decarboxylase-like enzyme|tara:strand:+ start:2806 stop:3186 length:381 start_codon:yes stop_codon:yes gene_type:complete
MIQEYRGINHDGVIYYGKHLILTANKCNKNILNKKQVANFMTELVDRIDMVAFGDPIVERFGEGIEIGLSAVQLIETSAIVIHTNDQARDMYLDVFSCKTFSEHDVINFLLSVFEPDKINSQVLLR